MALFAAAWGALGRLLLDWFLGRLGFNTLAQPPMLTFAVGPTVVWSVVAALLWTPLTSPLRRSTRRQAVWLGSGVACAGILMLYVLFVFQIGGVTSSEQVLGAVAFFPLFLISAVWMGGFIAVPATVGTAVLLRRLLRALHASASAHKAG